MLELLRRWSKLQPTVCRAVPHGNGAEFIEFFWCGVTLVCAQDLDDAQKGVILMAVIGAIASEVQPKLGWRGGVDARGSWAELFRLQFPDDVLRRTAVTFDEALLLVWLQYLEAYGK